MTLRTQLSIGALTIVTGTLGLVATPVQAQDVPTVVTAPSREGVPTRRVGYADLNLASLAGQRTLHRRVNFAVHGVCEESVGPRTDLLADRACKATAWNGAEPQIGRAIRRARDIAMRGRSTIAAAAIMVSFQK